MRSIILLFIPVLFVFGGSVYAVEPEAPARSGYRQDIDKALDKIEIELKDLEAKATQLKDKTKVEWDRTISDLKRDRDQLKERIKEGEKNQKAKAQDYWGRIKSALGELETGIKSAGRKLTRQEEKSPVEKK